MAQEHSKLPKFLDPDSMGGWVHLAQERMAKLHQAKQLPGKVPEITGVHSNLWLSYVKGLQGIWHIDMDGGMGPEFRSTFCEEIGTPLFTEDMQVTAATIVFSPETQYGGDLVPGPITDASGEVTFVTPEPRVRVGRGDGLMGPSEAGLAQIREHAKKGKRVLFIGRGCSPKIYFTERTDWIDSNQGAAMTDVTVPKGVCHLGDHLKSIARLVGPLVVVDTNTSSM